MKKESQYQRVKRMLEEAGAYGVTNTQFYAAYLPKFHARITELRQDGHNITTEFIRMGQFKYTLIPQRKLFDIPTNNEVKHV